MKENCQFLLHQRSHHNNRIKLGIGGNQVIQWVMTVCLVWVVIVGITAHTQCLNAIFKQQQQLKDNEGNIQLNISPPTLHPHPKQNSEPSHITTPTAEDDLVIRLNSRYKIRMQTYKWGSCPCIRTGKNMEDIQAALLAIKQEEMQPKDFPRWFLKDFGDQQKSTCSDYATQRGGGQNIFSYSYYTPLRTTIPDNLHYYKMLGMLSERASSIRNNFPGWLMRIYHNVTSVDEVAISYLCDLQCKFAHVDICDVRSLPNLGNLYSRLPIGRLWRFSTMGDPLVKTFMMRDSDSWILNREVAAVNEWLSSDKSFHVMRDHPRHKAIMLAGLWGGTNRDLTLMTSLRHSLFTQPLNFTKKQDQFLLANIVWPRIKNDVMQHDSYFCQVRDHVGSRPFPTQRRDGFYVGWGPFKIDERVIVTKNKCPIKCRPKNHPNWNFC